MDRAVDDFGRARKWTPAWVQRAKRICYRTIWTECDWRNYANRGVAGSIDVLPNDGYPSHGGDLDSVGLFQQRARWWGDTAGSMDPYIATTRFLTELADIDWFGMDESTACQAVQVSQFADASNYRARTEQTDALEADLLFFTNLKEM